MPKAVTFTAFLMKVNLFGPRAVPEGHYLDRNSFYINIVSHMTRAFWGHSGLTTLTLMKNKRLQLFTAEDCYFASGWNILDGKR